MKSVKQQIYETICRTYKVSPKTILPDLQWQDYGVDSLSLVELILTIKDKFKIEIKPDELEKVRTVNDLVAYVEKKTLTRRKKAKGL